MVQLGGLATSAGVVNRGATGNVLGLLDVVQVQDVADSAIGHGVVGTESHHLTKRLDHRLGLTPAQMQVDLLESFELDETNKP